MKYLLTFSFLIQLPVLSTAQSVEETALYFEGYNQSVGVSSNTPTDFHFKNEFTIEAWVKANELPHYGVIASNASGFKYQRYGYYFGINTSGIGSLGIEGSTSVSGTTNLTDGHWHHLAGIYKNDSLFIVADGVLEGAIKASEIDYEEGPALHIGNDYKNNHFIGAIDELRIWKVARSLNDINDFKNACLDGNENDLVVLYHFDGNENSTKVKDHTGNGHDGVLNNIDLDSWVPGKGCGSLTSISLPGYPAERKISLFPNPVQESFTINLEKTYLKALVSVVDIYGNEIYSSSVDNTNRLLVELEVKKGIYFLVIVADAEKSVIKLLKD